MFFRQSNVARRLIESSHALINTVPAVTGRHVYNKRIFSGLFYFMFGIHLVIVFSIVPLKIVNHNKIGIKIVYWLYFFFML